MEGLPKKRIKQKSTRRASISDIRRDELTAAALKCIATKGYDRITLEDVAKESGSSQGNILYYFKNREALMVATAERIQADMLEITRSIWGIPEGLEDEKTVHELIKKRCSEENIDFIAVIRYGVKLLINWYEENPHLIAVGLELFCQIRRNSVIEKIRDSVHPYIRNASAVFIGEGMKRGFFKKRDPKYAAYMLLSLISGFAFAHVTTKEGEFDPNILEQELCDLIFGYL